MEKNQDKYLMHLTTGELRELLKSTVRETLSERPQETPIPSPPKPAEVDELLDTRRAIELLKCSRNTLFSWVKHDIVQSVLLGGKRFYRRNDLLNLVSGKKGRKK